MKGLSKNQWLVIFAGVLLTVLIYLAPRKTSDKLAEERQLTKTSDTLDLEDVYTSFRDSVLKNVSPLQAERLRALENLNDETQNDSLFLFFKNLRQPFLAAYWAGKIAESKPTFENITQAGRFFYIGFEFAPNLMVKQLSINEAIKFYNKALEVNPDHIPTQIDLAGCYVEGSADPMKGIGILREVLQKDSNNVAAQFKMGIFAVRSQQFEKAVERFKKVLVVEPNNTEALLYLGECYATLGNKLEALKALERFKQLSDDAIINAEVDEFIEKLKRS